MESFRFSNFDEKSGIVPLPGRDLDYVAKAGFEFFVGIHPEPEGDRSTPILSLIINVVLPSIKDNFRRLL